jgi:aminopeptidase N
LNDQKIDAQFKALILSLPSDTILAQEEKVLNPQAFSAAKSEITIAFVKKFEKEIHPNLSKSITLLNSTGDRALKNLLLHHLVTAGFVEGLSLCEKQYQTASNMTDSFHALIVLCDSNSFRKKMH